MLGLQLPAGDPLRILAIGAHADDIEIGCGATLLSLIARHPSVEVTWLVMSAHGARAGEARAAAAAFLEGAASADVRLEDFRDGFMPYAGGRAKEVFEALKARVDPAVVFTHTERDRHQDHRLVCELTWNTFRDHLVLEYEIPKYDGDLGMPNVFMPVAEDVARRKAKLLRTHFPSQAGKHWFDDDLFLGLMRLRGAECATPTRHAEAFYGRKLVIGARTC